MSTMRIYTSSDASAPTLQGIVGGAYSSGWADGSLLNLLDKILVSGYGSKTAAGWARSFTGTSKGVFRQGSGCQFYMRVLDDGTMTAGAREAQFYGGETASDVDTLVNQFPTAAQQATYLKMRKSDTADTVQRPWICFADDKTFYLFTMPIIASAYYAAMAFGNFHSYVVGDAFNCMAIGRVTSAAIDASGNENLDIIVSGAFLTSAVSGHYLARPYTQAGSSSNFPKWLGTGSTGSNSAFRNGAGTSSIPYPNPADNTLLLSRLYVMDNVGLPTTCVRGYLRGMYGFGQTSTSIALGFAFNGQGSLAGKTMKVLGLPSGGASGRYIMETSDTWDS
jgi:hypothetical protein